MEHYLAKPVSQSVASLAARLSSAGHRVVEITSDGVVFRPFESHSFDDELWFQKMGRHFRCVVSRPDGG